MFWLLPRIPTQHQHFLLFPHSAAQQDTRVGNKLEGDTAKTSGPSWATGMLHTRWSPPKQQKLREGGFGAGSHCLGTSWASVTLWQVRVTAFASLLSSLRKTILISTHEFSHFCSPRFPSHPAGRGRELRRGCAAAVWCLAAGRGEPTTTKNTLNLF